MSEHNYHLGLLHGPFRQYYNNGDLAHEGQYQKGRPTGTHTTYLRGGRKLLEKKYSRRKKRPDLSEQLFNGRRLRLEWRNSRYHLVGSTIESLAKKICAVDYKGTVRCLTIDELVDRLGRALSPEQVENILGVLNDLYAALGLDPNERLLVGCGGGVHSIAMDVLAVPTGRRSSPSATRATPGELTRMTAACQVGIGDAGGIAAGETGGPSGGLNGSIDDNAVQSTIEQVDDAVAACRRGERRKGGVDPIASDGAWLPDPEIAWQQWKNDVRHEAVKEYIAADHPFPIDVGGRQVWATNSDFRADNGRAILELAISLLAVAVQKAEDDQLRDDARRAQADAERAAAADDAERAKQAEEQKQAPPTTPPPATPQEEEAEQCLENAQCTEPDGTEPTPGMPAPDGDTQTCEDIERRWEDFKLYCDDTKWQDYRCLRFLSVANGCVDPSRILPGPDGDLTCPERHSATLSDAHRAACEKQKLISVPSGFGTETCRPIDAVGDIERDFCSDPRAEWLPDQCLPMGQPVDSAPPQPRPYLDSGVHHPERVVV